MPSSAAITEFAVAVAVALGVLTRFGMIDAK
jgi:uncharacterized membrane protein YphA (DoxX/SURF4 family)